MGAWGTGTDENDETHDVIYKVMDDKKKLEKFLKKPRLAGYYKHPGPIVYAAKHKIRLSRKVKKSACKYLSKELKMLKSGKNPLEWKNVKKRMLSIKKELKMLKC